MAWRNNLQTASFRGIQFDVKDIDDANSKALVLHQYAYKDGADIEDLGNDSEEVSLTAVFWGDDYEVKFIQLLEALSMKGPGTLVHPVRGRMPNMHAASYHFTHEAENIDYVRFTISFKKSIEESPIFSLSSVFSVIDDLFNKADSLIAFATDYFSAFMTSLNKVKSYRARARSVTATFKTLGYEVERLLLESDGDSLSTQSVAVGSEIGDYSVVKLEQDIEHYIEKTSVKNTALPNTELSSLQSAIDTLDVLPIKIGKGESRLDLGVPISLGDVIEVQIVLKVVLNAVYIKKITSIIEEDNLSVIEIENIVNHARTLTDSTITAIRSITAKADDTYVMVKSLRDIQHELKVLAVSYIAKKPPLIVLKAPITGTLQQVAFMLYRDHYRFVELLQLNPQITHPNFIQEGVLLNAYTE